MPKIDRSKPAAVWVTVSLHQPLYTALRARAAADGERSVASVVRHLLRRAIAAEEIARPVSGAG
jgi:plasmid stability protein